MEKESNRVKYMDIPVMSSRSLSPSSVSSNSDLGFYNNNNKNKNSPNRNCCRDLTQSLENLSDYSSDSSCLSGSEEPPPITRPKVINFEEDLQRLAEQYYRSKDKKQRNSATVTIECVDIGLSAEEKKKLQKRNKSLGSITKLFKSFSLSKSTKSLNNTPTKQKSKKQTEAPKTIYRRPVEYVYVKGMSGLATQRVPRSSICCQYS